jgi:hypothetical protein
MRGLDTFTPEISRLQARLASGFHQHVAIALTACLLGLLLG